MSILQYKVDENRAGPKGGKEFSILVWGKKGKNNFGKKENESIPHYGSYRNLQILQYVISYNQFLVRYR